MPSTKGKGMDDIQKITLVMVGPTGQGKSTLGNMVAGGGEGYAPFTTSDDFDSETLESAHADFEWNFNRFRTIDTIGFLDTRMDASQNMDKFAGFADRAPGGIDVFLFVLKKGRFTEQSMGQIHAFRAVAGDDAMKHCILVFTHCGSETNESLRERVQSTTNQYLKEAVEMCADFLGVDSLATDRDDRQNLLEAVMSTIKSNGGRKYDNRALGEARRRREVLLDKIRTLDQERREAMEDKINGLFHGRVNFDQVEKAVDEAIERAEAQRRAEEERISLQALLAAAQSEAQAWKEVARSVLGSQNSGGGMLGLSGCCGPPAGGPMFDSNEIRVDTNAPVVGAGGGGGAATARPGAGGSSATYTGPATRR